MIGNLGIIQECVKIHYNRQNEIYIENHRVYHERRNHVDICLHLVRAMIESKDIIVEKVASEDNLI